jgi:hypothetical protein
MNKRIIELADQAGFLTENGKFYADSFDAINDEVEAFAELIIQECAKIADDNFNKGFCPVGDYIKQHFGVE